jgi:hypothetical protein
MRIASPYQRPQDWPERLAKHLLDALQKPFQWGVNDCATLACDGALAVAGVDPMASLRGTYATEQGADAIISAAGGFAALAQQLADQAGLPASPVPFAQRGDLVLIERGNMLMLGLVTDSGVAVAGEDGLAFLPLRKAVMAWSV